MILLLLFVTHTFFIVKKGHIFRWYKWKEILTEKKQWNVIFILFEIYMYKKIDFFPSNAVISYVTKMLFLLAYCLVVSSFLTFSLRTKSLLSKVSTILFFSRFWSCILLFSFGLNKLSSKYIWKIPKVTKLRSCTFSSTIHIFTKSCSWLLKASTKWKKAVSIKASSSFFVKFLQALRLNLIFTRVILLLVWVICSVPNKIFSITFLSPWIVKFFKPSSTKESKKKMSVLGWMSSMIHQCIPRNLY